MEFGVNVGTCSIGKKVTCIRTDHIRNSQVLIDNMGAIKKNSMNNLEVEEGRRAWEEVRLFYRVDACNYWCKRESRSHRVIG